MKGYRGGYDHVLKLIIIGDSSVGKTCLLLRFSEDNFPLSHMPTIGKSVLLLILHCRNRFQNQDNRRLRPENQALSLGHRRPGAVQDDHADLLQRSDGDHPRVRLHRGADFRQREELDKTDRPARAEQRQENFGCEQMRQK